MKLTHLAGKIPLPLLIFLLLPYPIQGMEIRGIRVIGERAISPREIKGTLSLRKGEDYRPQEIARGVERVLALYRSRGYLAAEVKLKVGAAGILTLNIAEGDLALVGRLQFRGNSFLTARDLSPLLETRPGRRFDQGMIQRDIERVIELYESNGFPFCEVSLTNWGMEGDKVNLELHIMEGPRVRIERLQVVGNVKTKGSFIRRVSGIRLKEYFDQGALHLAQAKLERTGLFIKVGRPQLRILDEPQRGEVIISVEEKPNNRAEGILGYSASPQGELSGNLLLSLGNMGGVGRKAKLRWQRLNLGDSMIEFGYQEPYFCHLPFSLGGRVQEREKKGQFNRFSASLNLATPLSGRVDWEGGARWERVVGDDTSGSMRRYSVETKLSLDTRDHPPNPHKGVLYSTSLEYGWRRDYQPGGGLHKGWNTKIITDLEPTLPVLSQQALNLRLHLAQIKGDQTAVSLSDQFPIGGGNSIRGYTEEAGYGSLVAWLNLEYRFLLGRLSRFYPFFDYGYFSFPQGKGNRSGRMWGYGLGLSVGSPRGVVGLDIGWGRGASLGQAKLHLRLVNNF